VESYAPGPQLRDRVVSIERVVSSGHSSRVLPAAGAVLGLQVSGRVLGPEGPMSALGVTGIPDAARRYSYDGPTETFLVRFRPQGATCLGLPAHLLRGKSLPLDELWEAPRRARSEQLMNEMLSASDPARRVALLEGFLAELPFRRDMRLEKAMQLLSQPVKEDVGGQVALASSELGLSPRQLERLFLERVGVSPKRYARLRRFERAVRLAQKGQPLGEVACASGYSDQAHFIRDFRSLTGEAPRSFLKSSDFVL
jgi:AraC-like DNA-binding protein